MKRLIEKILVKMSPPAFYRAIGGLWGYLVRPRRSYSQYGEDLIIEDFFLTKGIKQGVYVDVGAFHPKWLSNTHKLHKLGWKGSAVDIDAHKISLFKMMRTNCKGFIGAVVPRGIKSDFLVYRFHKLWSEIDTLSKEDAERYQQLFNVGYDVSPIKTMSINDVLNETYRSFGSVNFINIDIEGLDEAILFDLDFDRFRPDLVCFENNLQFSGSMKLQTLLSEKGYKHLFSAGGTHGYFYLSTQGNK